MRTENDYRSWSTEELVSRVTDLEAQLRSQCVKHEKVDAHTSSTSSKKKPRKPAKHFDSSRYSTRLIALKFAYLGSNYNGFEHHSNNTTPLPTIEEELWKALKKTKLIFPEHKAGQSEDDVSWEGCEYSKCGRTDRGVSAFGQVIGIRVRSNGPKLDPVTNASGSDVALGTEEDNVSTDTLDARRSKPTRPPFDAVRDELPYIQLINRVLPPDIRILAWCPDPPESFSARFNCRERRYRYFFTNPAYSTLPGERSAPGRPAEGWLDIKAMQDAARRYQGSHDFRNLCKVDPSKQISNFERRIFHAGIHEVRGDHAPNAENGSTQVALPHLYYFEVRGSAFLWHQVRHLVAILFLVGQGYESPNIVDELLDTQKTPAKPVYDMASDVPLVLWDCIFPRGDSSDRKDQVDGEDADKPGYQDALNWVYVGDEVGGRETSKSSTVPNEDGKYGRNGIMDALWALWRKRKMDEVLAWSLMGVVSAHGSARGVQHSDASKRSARIFDGGEGPRTVGKYVPVLQREKLEPPEVVNARYAARKNLIDKVTSPPILDDDQ